MSIQNGRQDSQTGSYSVPLTEPLLRGSRASYLEDDKSSLRNDPLVGIIDRFSVSQGYGSVHTNFSTASVVISKLGILMTGVNLAGSVIGMGNLEFPYFMLTWGFIPTMIFFVISFFLMYYSCLMLWNARIMSGKQDLCKISLHCFGKWGIIAHICIFFYNTGICIAFVVIYFQTLYQLFVTGFGLSTDNILMSETLQTFLFILMNFPFLFALTVKGLKFASIGVFLCHIFFIIALFLNFVDNYGPETFGPNFVWWPTFDKGFKEPLTVLPVVIMAFGFQFNFFPVMHCLQDPTMERVKKSSILGLTFPLLFYIAIGFFGYAVYQDKTKPNFLLSFQPNQIGGFAFSLTFFSFIAAIILTFPIYFFEARNLMLLILNVLFGREKLITENQYSQDILKSTNNKLEVSPFRWDQYFYIVLMFALIIFVGIEIPGIKLIFGVIGATAGNLLALILPAAFYIHLANKKDEQNISSEFVSSRLLCISYFSLILGVFIGVISLVFMYRSKG